MLIIKRQALGLLLLILSNSVHGQEYATTHIIELSPGIGYYNFDSDSNLKNKSFMAIGFGLHFTRRWAVLLHYSAINTTTESTNQSVDVQEWHIDGHYFFNIKRHLRPYLVAGYGQVDYDPDHEERRSNNIFNAGLGLHYRMTPKWSIRSDIRKFLVAGFNYNDNALTCSLGYRFGGGERGN